MPCGLHLSSCLWDLFPAQVSALLQDLTEALRVFLGQNMVGIYLYGSLTQNAFNPERSDVDCIVVTHRELTDTQFSQLDGWFNRVSLENPWGAGLQISFLIRDQILTVKGNCLYQFGRLSRVGSDGNPIIWMNVLESGVVLLGPPADRSSHRSHLRLSLRHSPVRCAICVRRSSRSRIANGAMSRSIASTPCSLCAGFSTHRRTVRLSQSRRPPSGRSAPYRIDGTQSSPKLSRPMPAAGPTASISVPSRTS